MKMKTHWLTAAQVALALSCVAAPKPHALTVEYRTNPVGIDVAAPRFSWKLPEGVKRQSAYEIDAGVWKTGKVASDESLNAATWGGPALRPSQRVSWRVRVWDENGAAGDWSDPATFVMGRLGNGDGQAKWIGPNRLTRPDVDFGEARWIEGEKVGGSFTWDGSAAGAPAVAADGHYVEFLQAIRGEGPYYDQVHSRCFSDVDYSVPIMEGILVGCIAQQDAGPVWLIGSAFSVYVVHSIMIRTVNVLGVVPKGTFAGVVEWTIVVVLSFMVAIVLHKGLPRISKVLFGGR